MDENHNTPVRMTLRTYKFVEGRGTFEAILQAESARAMEIQDALGPVDSENPREVIVILANSDETT